MTEHTDDTAPATSTVPTAVHANPHASTHVNQLRRIVPPEMNPPTILNSISQPRLAHTRCCVTPSP